MNSTRAISQTSKCVVLMTFIWVGVSKLDLCIIIVYNCLICRWSVFSPFLLKARDVSGGTIKSTTLRKQREKCIILKVRNLTYMLLVSPDHTHAHTCMVWVKVKQLEAEGWESALNSSNLHGNVMSALPFDHRKCVPTKGLTPALLKIRIRFYNYYQLQSAARQQMLHRGVLMWMAVGISQTKDFTLGDCKWKEHQRSIL